jgi:hypothetical protein
VVQKANVAAVVLQEQSRLESSGSPADQSSTEATPANTTAATTTDEHAQLLARR